MCFTREAWYLGFLLPRAPSFPRDGTHSSALSISFMLQRFPVLQSAGLVLIIAALLWFSATRRNTAIPTDGMIFPDQFTAQRKIAGTNTRTEHFPNTGTSASDFANEINPTPLGQILDLLQQKQLLGPTEREKEDEIRSTLLALLTDENAAAILSTLPAQWRSTEFGVATLERWASVDALGATLWLAQQPDQSPEQTHALAAAISKEPILLELVCTQLPSSTWREALLEDLCRSVLPENPRAAIQLAQQLQSGPARKRALLRIADDWTTRDPVSAARWIMEEPDLFLRDELIFAGSAALASTNPTEAFAWTTSISSPATFDRALGKIATLWTSYAPQQAGQFIERIGLPPPTAATMDSNLSR